MKMLDHPPYNLKLDPATLPLMCPKCRLLSFNPFFSRLDRNLYKRTWCCINADCRHKDDYPEIPEGHISRYDDLTATEVNKLLADPHNYHYPNEPQK